MTNRSGFRVLRSLTVLAVLVFGAVAALAPPRAEDLPPALQQDLEGVVKKKIGDLLNEKNPEGKPYKRGSFSRNFHKVDDSTYTVTFHQDTAGKDRLKTERFLLTLKKDASGKWAIANQELKDTYEGLSRGVLGDEEFAKFDKLVFEREGLKVHATNGSCVRDFYEGKTSYFLCVAPDLTYDYTPPQDLDIYQMYQAVMMKEYLADVVFKPAQVRFSCDSTSCQDIEKTAFTGLHKVTLAETDSKLQQLYDDARKDLQKQLDENPFTGFRRPYEEERRVWTVALKRDSAKDYWVWLGFDTYDPKEVTFNTSETGPLYSYYAESIRKGDVSPYDLERRDDADGRDYEIYSLKGSVDLGLEDPNTLSGDVTYGMTIKRTLRELPFRIARLQLPGADLKEIKNPKLFINGLSDGDGNELTWVKTGPFSALIVFPKPVEAGTKVSVKLKFTNLDSVLQINPSYSLVDRTGWLPFVRFGDLIDEMDLTVRVPEKYTALGIGKKVSEVKKDGASVSRWVADSPVDFPTVIFGDYIEATPNIKATKSDGTEIPVHVYVDKVSTNMLDSDEAFGGGAREIRGKQLKAIGDQAVNALNLYREVYGIDYPYGKLDLVDDPLGFLYGQSPASIVYLGFGVFRGEGTIATMGNDSGQLAKFLKDVVAHEVGHQWWGSAISNANFGNYWFVESLAEYSSAIFVENVYGRKKYDEKVAEWRKRILETEMLTGVQGATSAWGGEFPGAAYTANVYNKGPYAFHILRSTFGDAKFFAFLKAMAQELKGKEIVTRDIQQAMEKAYGGNMEWFFDQWIRGVGTPQYAINYTVRQTEDGKYLVEGTIKQRVVAGKNDIELKGKYFRAVAPLTFITEDGKEMKAPKPLLVQGAETPFKMKLDVKPVEVLFNYHGEILAKDVLVNRGW